eukprot:9108158-Heterocapsa_arctica.AAC.1
MPFTLDVPPPPISVDFIMNIVASWFRDSFVGNVLPKLQLLRGEFIGLGHVQAHYPDYLGVSFQR